jgi:methyl-accepting chemotaxis protein
MSSTAEQGASKAASVACVSGDASSDVQTFATATEELSASITEISRQVAESVQALADAAKRIGDVVELLINGHCRADQPAGVRHH